MTRIGGGLLLAIMGLATLWAQDVQLREDFESGAARWSPTEAAKWQVATEHGNACYRLLGKSDYQPPHRSPHSIALLDSSPLGDFDLRVRVRSTTPDYGHRDVCVVFGYQDPAHFYYAHLGRATDDHANQIFIVNGADRKKISLTSTPGTDWTDNWHTVRIIRRVNDGTIEIYFDDLQKPVMTAKDTTFTWGRIGVGTFDDTADWDDIVLRGKKVEQK